MTLLYFAILVTAVQYVLGGSTLLAPLRSHLPAFIRTGVECPACCGFWLGLIVEGAVHFRGAYIVHEGRAGLALAGACGMVFTAIGRSLMSLGYVEETKKDS